MEGGAILPNALGNKTMPGGMPGIQWGQQIYHINNNSCCLLHIWAYCQERREEASTACADKGKNSTKINVFPTLKFDGKI